MKTQLSSFVLGVALLSPVLGFSQEQAIQPCNTYAAMEEAFAADPQARPRYEAAQQQLQANYEAYNASQAANRTTSLTQYTIPVVFHILHMGGAENITDAQCIAALAQINKDYAKANPDTTQIFAPFQSSYINSGIKFMLAHKDPQGNCTSGIIHTYDQRTNWNQATTSSFTGITWDPTKYLNVIIVKQIIPTGTVTGGGIIVGYTYVPGTWPTGSAADAVVYNYNYLNGLQARSMSHEFGHWLGLKHTFGNTNNPGVSCGDDGISDTPVTKGNFSTCPASNTNSTVLCNAPASNGSYYQNVQNIMDYSSCPLNFTTGQTNMMRSVLASSVNQRNNVTSASNLTATDVNGTTPCAPIADYVSTNNSYTVCAGGSLSMKDMSYNGNITTYQWTGSNGASFASANASLTSVSFPVVGTSDVTLTVSNAQGSSTKVKTVTVIDGSVPNGLPAMESFENPGVPAHWAVSNSNGAASGWDWTQGGAYDGSASFFVDGSAQAANQENYLQMPVMNLAASTDKSISFAYAYAKAASTTTDVLKVQGSKDCGGTWADIIILSATQMATGSGGTTSSPYYPATGEWKTFTISTQPVWSQYTSSSSVTLRFNFIESSTGAGNNMYIDAVNMVVVTGINELTKNMQLSVYPNPTSAETTVEFKLDDAANMKINVVDIYGRVVMPVMDSRLVSGQQSISINKDGKLASGIYFIDMTYNGTKISRKLIVE